MLDVQPPRGSGLEGGRGQTGQTPADNPLLPPLALLLFFHLASKAASGQDGKSLQHVTPSAEEIPARLSAAAVSPAKSHCLLLPVPPHTTRRRPHLQRRGYQSVRTLNTLKCCQPLILPSVTMHHNMCSLSGRNEVKRSEQQNQTCVKQRCNHQDTAVKPPQRRSPARRPGVSSPRPLSQAAT